MKKKNILLACICVCALLAATGLFLLLKGDKQQIVDSSSFEYVKKTFNSDIEELKNGKYNNLIYVNFTTSIEEVDGVYNIEIMTDTEYRDKTFLENFKIMNEVIDKFFVESIDKSYLVADFYMSNEEKICVNYNDIEVECVDDKYNQPRSEFLFGNNTANGGYMIQITECLTNTWFSRNELGDILPSTHEYKKVYPYISCIRQVNDVEINLKDGKILLSELECNVLDYLNNQFPLPKSKDISFGIGDVRILYNGEYEGVCFKARRIYKGIPFEYGYNVSSGMFIDYIDHDRGELDYAMSSYPDTMLSFGRINGNVVETEKIEEMLTLGDALEILSDKVGENSIYEVHGVELVYRECNIPEERVSELDDILEPKWKIITINQNDDKYTLFYVDVVTGEITERFEYYYD